MIDKMLAMIVALVVALVSPVCGKVLDPGFTMEYFRPKNVEQIVVFACWNESG